MIWLDYHALARLSCFGWTIMLWLDYHALARLS